MPKKIVKTKLILIIAFSVISNSLTFAQKRDSTIDIYSRVSCYVQIYNGTTRLGNATGFFFNTGKKLYFITNNHVVGGKFFIDEYKRIKKQDPPQNIIPDKLSIRVYGKALNDTMYVDLQIRINNKPTYLTFKNSPQTNDLMDVVAIPIPESTVAPNNIDVIYLEDRNVERGLVLYPATDLFIVGFPFDFARFSVYPIWKRGTIASEPNLVDSNKFIIDATARSGMSGSPVYFRGTTYIANKVQYMGGGLTTFLIGVYSAQNVSAEIGIVWKFAKVIDELKKLDQ